MSELIAEARVLVTPDTTKFRPLLTAQLASATKGIVVPVPVTPVISDVGLLAQETTALSGLTAAQRERAGAADAAAKAEEEVAASAARHTRQLGQLQRGVGATALSFAGLRGATLAASGSFIIGAAGAVTFAKALSSATSFNTQLKTFEVTAGASADQMARVSAAAKELGQDITLPGVSALDAAQAFTELSKAGLSVEDSLAGARGVLQLATAAGIDNATATELAASALNAFALQGDQAVHVADVLANSANDAQGSIADIGIALRQSAAAAKQSGLTLEQTVAILTEFARAGIQSSDAGTLLRTLLIRLINPTDKAAQVIKKLGLNLRDAQGNIRLDVFEQFAAATRNMTSAERDRDAAIIAGQDAFRGLSILARQGSGALEAEVAAVSKAGTAAQVASARTSGLAGSFENAKNQASTFGLTLGQVATGPAQVFVTAAGNMFESLNKISSTLGSIFHPERANEFDETTKNFTQLAEAAAHLQQNLSTGDAGEFTGQLTVGLQAVAAQLARTGKDLVRQGFLTQVLQTFIRLSPDVKRAMADNVITPAEQAQLEATALGRAFIEAVPHTADLFQSFGASAKSGIEDAGAAIRGSGPTLAEATAEAIHDSAGAVRPVARQTGTEIGNTITGAIAAAIKNAQGQVADLFASVTRTDRLRAGRQASALVDIEFQGGTPQQQLTGLRDLLATQKQIVDDLVGRGAPRAKIDAAKQDAIATQNKIDSVISEINSANDATVNKAKQAASNREAKAREAAAARDRADQAVLDSFAPAQARLNLQAIGANASERLSDNLALQNAIITEAKREVAIITKTVQDVKTRNEALRQQAAIIRSAEVERANLIKQIAQTATENRQKAADAVTAALGKRIQLAELRGNEQQELVLINKAIADEQKRIKAWKKLGLNVLDEKIALQNLINKRDELLGVAKDANQGVDAGTTLVDLFKNTQEIAAQAGTVGRLPRDLTSSAANAPIRDLVNQRLDIQLANPGVEAAAKAQVTTTERLISTMEQLIQVIGPGTGIRVGGNQGTPGLGKALDTAARFRYQRVASSIVEGGIWG